MQRERRWIVGMMKRMNGRANSIGENGNRLDSGDGCGEMMI